MYSTSPVSKIVGSFEVEEIIEDTPESVWEMCHSRAAISEYEFFRYFDGAAIAFAIKMANTQRFVHPLYPRIFFDGFRPPQSFRYVAFAIGFHDGDGKRKKARNKRSESKKREGRTD